MGADKPTGRVKARGVKQVEERERSRVPEDPEEPQVELEGEC